MSKIKLRFFYFFLFFFILILNAGFLNFAFAQEKPVINLFYSKTCPHCAQEEVFLKKLQKNHPKLNINKYEISDSENVKLLKDFYKKYNVSKNAYGAVPATFIGDNYFVGFNEKIGQEIEKYITANYKKADLNNCQSQEDETRTIEIPFFGELDIHNYSLPVLAVVLGVLDGFNVCSLGALVLILGLVLALKERKKIFLAGGVFLLITAVIYGALIALWYHIFSFLSPYIRAMEILIGLIGLVGGFYFLKEFYRLRKYGATCEPGIGNKMVSKFRDKIDYSLKYNNTFWVVLALVSIFAIALTVVEFPCSAAVPLVFAGILAKAEISSLSYLVYILLFILFYLLDEIIIFLIAVLTLNLKIIPEGAVKWAVLIEAIILLFLGIYYLFGFSLFI